MLNIKASFSSRRLQRILSKINNRYSRQSGVYLAGFTALLGMVGNPVQGAEEIRFFYGPLERNLKVNSLKVYAENGSVNQNLQDIFNLVKPGAAEAEKLRQLLVKPIQVNPVLLSRLLNTDEGGYLLERLGSLIEIQGGRNGKLALRGAMIQAAAAPQGWTILGFMETLPVNMQINLANVSQFIKQADYLVKATQQLVTETGKLSSQETQNSADLAPDYGLRPNLAQRGKVPFQLERWNLTDSRRNRRFYVDVYLPQLPLSAKTSVIVFSHGLGERPETYKEVGEVLASHGFLVAMPQHPGSDTTQKEALLTGEAREIFRLNEFVDRPLDLSFTLDELERRNQTKFGGRLALAQVGAYGHSFGGYTALAVAGATIDRERLKQDCASPAATFNQAILLQCRALQLPPSLPPLKDERIGAVLIFNPVNASIYGESGLAKIKVPIFVGAGGYDLTTPFVFEQARSFPWLSGAPKRYLLLQEADGHVPPSKLGAGSEFMVTSLLKLTLPDDNLRPYYATPFILAFSQAHVANRPDYQTYLRPSYAAYLSRGQEFKAFLITEQSAGALEENFQSQADGFQAIR